MYKFCSKRTAQSFQAMKLMMVGAVLSANIFGVSVAFAAKDETVLNLYSARHYQTDEALYSDFTKTTGIKINRLEADDNALVERLKSEGARSPADVILMVDAARLWRAQVDGLFQPIRSNVLESRIPEHLRGNLSGDASDKGIAWFGFSTRARIIVYNKANMKPSQVDTYEKLADPVNQGKVCTRSGAHPYMLSLIGSMVELRGAAATEEWAKGMVKNMARSPKGGDTDQIKGVASGECGVALTNSYYWARLMRSTNPADQEVVTKVGFVWPNQQLGGTHINVAGGAVAKNAPHKEAAIKFLEYLSSDKAQKYFADGNNEWPVVKSVKSDNPALKQMGDFKAQQISISSIGKNQIAAQKILDRVGYK
jgi:iron(III) transport system substrate-binding protein